MTPAAEALLEKLAVAGRLRPEVVVEEARDSASPLHDFFVWDDARAAALHRLEQARALIRSVRVEVIVNRQAIAVPKYVHDPEADGKGGGYVQTVRLVDDRERAARVMRDELQRVLGTLERTRAIATLLGVEELVDRAVSGTRAVLDRVEARPAVEAGAESRG